MGDLRSKQSSLLQLIHILWDDPGSSYQIADQYWELRESDHLEINPDVDNYNSLVNQCCRKVVERQVELDKLIELLRIVL